MSVLVLRGKPNGLHLVDRCYPAFPPWSGEGVHLVRRPERLFGPCSLTDSTASLLRRTLPMQRDPQHRSRNALLLRLRAVWCPASGSTSPHDPGAVPNSCNGRRDQGLGNSRKSSVPQPRRRSNFSGPFRGYKRQLPSERVTRGTIHPGSVRGLPLLVLQRTLPARRP